MERKKGGRGGRGGRGAGHVEKSVGPAHHAPQLVALPHDHVLRARPAQPTAPEVL
jgi:hypothetical protein